MASILCQDCGEPRHRVPHNTRYCAKCRLLRNLDYWRDLTRRCECGRRFAPLDRGDRRCSSCSPGLRAYSGTCALARDGHEGRYTSPYLPVCAGCARDPAKRGRLIAALEKGQRQRREQHAYTQAT